MSLIHLHQPSACKLQEAGELNIPILVTGIFDNWKNVMKWTPAYLKENYGKEIINISKNISEQEVNPTITTKMGDYINWLDAVEDGRALNNHNHYFAESAQFLKSTGLQGELDGEFATLLPKNIYRQLRYYAFWLGPKNSSTGFHYDLEYRNYLALIHGRKEFLLVDPKQTTNMYPSQRFEHGSRASLVNIWKDFDLRKYPNFEKVIIKKITIHPGQMLYIPAKWWHAVRNLDTTVAVSLRYETLFSTYTRNAAEEIRNFLHCIGLWGSKNNCICHDRTADDNDVLPNAS